MGEPDPRFEDVVQGFEQEMQPPATPIYDQMLDDYMRRKAIGRMIVYIILTIIGSAMILWLPATLFMWGAGWHRWPIIISGIASALIGVVLVAIGADRDTTPSK
jgi:hypothetical protein